MSGKLTCGTSVSTATVFTASGSSLVNGAGTTWYASAVPSGSTQAGVETASDATGLMISWAGS